MARYPRFVSTADRLETFDVPSSVTVSSSISMLDLETTSECSPLLPKWRRWRCLILMGQLGVLRYPYCRTLRHGARSFQSKFQMNPIKWPCRVRLVSNFPRATTHRRRMPGCLVLLETSPHSCCVLGAEGTPGFHAVVHCEFLRAITVDTVLDSCTRSIVHGTSRK